MHRVPGLRSRRTLVYLVPVAIVVTVGLVFGLTSLRSSSGPDLTARPVGFVNPIVQTSPTEAPPAPSSMPKSVDLGVAHGTLTLHGPSEATDGSFVVVFRDGKKQVLKKTVRAASAVKIDTKALPNGSYTVTMLWTHDGETSVASTGTVQIKNPKPKPTPTPSSAPSTQAAAPKPSHSSSAGSGSAGSSSGGSSSSGSSTTAPPAAGTGFAEQVLELANTARSNAGCKTPLKLNSDLNTAAQGHSDDMVAHNLFSHSGSNGSSPFQRMTDAGYHWAGAAENIAAGSTTAAGAMTQWMNSPGHKANILNCGLVDLGVGYTAGVNDDYSGYWTQDFGSPL